MLITEGATAGEIVEAAVEDLAAAKHRLNNK